MCRCNQVGFFQDGAPTNTRTLVTRLVEPIYDEVRIFGLIIGLNDLFFCDQRQCTYWFPEKFKTPTPPNVDALNKAYDGWNVAIDRLFFANGLRTCFGH